MNSWSLHDSDYDELWHLMQISGGMLGESVFCGLSNGLRADET